MLGRSQHLARSLPWVMSYQIAWLDQGLVLFHRTVCSCFKWLRLVSGLNLRCVRYVANNRHSLLYEHVKELFIMKSMFTLHNNGKNQSTTPKV